MCRSFNFLKFIAAFVEALVDIYTGSFQSTSAKLNLIAN